MAGILGCATKYSAQVHYRGRDGQLRLYRAIDGITSVAWGRRLNDVSTASITVSKAQAGSDCCGAIGALEPWGHELSLYRDGKLVWQGPILEIEEGTLDDAVTISAVDVIGWLSVRTVGRSQYFFNYTVPYMLWWILNEALSIDDPAVLPFYQLVNPITGPTGERNVTTDALALDEWTEIAKMGADYTTVGRRVIMRPPTPWNATRPAYINERHFLGNLKVRRSGRDFATRAVMIGEGTAAGQPPTRADVTDQFYGLVEKVFKADKQTNWPTVDLMASQALSAYNPMPNFLIVPDGSALSPNTPLSVDDLVCGAQWNVSTESTCRKIRQAMRLTKVDGSWSSTGTEKIGVSLIPYTEDLSDG